MSGTAAKNEPVRQHTVPRMLLKNFVLPGRKGIIEIQRKSGKWFPVAIEKASVEKDFYTIRDKDGQKNYDVEKELGELERVADPIIQKLINQGVRAISTDERFTLSRFLAVQINRTRLTKAFARESFNRFRTSKDSLKLLERLRPELERLVEESEIEQFVDRVMRGEPLQDDPNFFVKSCLQSVSPELIDAINEIRWHIETAKAGSCFVIGDSPVAVRRRGRLEDPHIVGINRSDLNAEMYFPFARNKVLVGSWDRSRSTSIKVGKLRVQEVNKKAIVVSTFSVFSPSSDPNIIRLVNELRNFSVTIKPFDFSKD